MSRPATINFTRRDFDSILAAIKSSIPSSDTPEWNDFLSSNTGMTILNLFAAIADMENYYIDRQGAECYIKTAIARSNIANILQLINYSLKNATPAYITIRVSLYNAVSSDVIIPQWTEFSSRDGSTRFVTSVPAVISAGQISVDIPARQGAFQSDIYSSDGTSGQRFIISRTDIGEGFIQVFVNNEQWTLADDNSMIGHSPTDKVYKVGTIGFDSGVATYVQLGDGLEGKIPAINSSIEIKYLVTKGDQVAVIPGSITQLISKIYDVNGNEVQPMVTNTDRAQGGQPPESVENARNSYPRRFKTLGRAVTKSDFQSLAENYPGVLLARVYDLNDTNEVPFFRAQVYAVPEDGYDSNALNATLSTYLQKMAIMGMNEVVVSSPDPVIVDLTLSIRVFRSFDQSEVRMNVIIAVQNFFDLARNHAITDPTERDIDIGSRLAMSRLIDVVQEVPGVSSFTITPDNDVVANYNQIIRLGSLIVTVVAQV